MKKEQLVRNKTLNDLRVKAMNDFGSLIQVREHSAFPYQHLDGIEFHFVKGNHTVRVNAWQSDNDVIFQQTVLIGTE